MQKLFFLIPLFTLLRINASAQELNLPHDAVKDEAALASAMPMLAKHAIATYQEPDRGRYLNTLFQLQLVAGQNWYNDSYVKIPIWN